MGGIFHGAGGLPAVPPKAVEPRTINQRGRNCGAGTGGVALKQDSCQPKHFFHWGPAFLPILASVGGLILYG